ncbi:MAG: hypothetical protein ABIT36_02100 [Steroidobacteraceae bacterium]
MRPLALLLGIVAGSAVSMALGLGMTLMIFFLLPEFQLRLAGEWRPLTTAFGWALALTAAGGAAFYGELRTRRWRRLAQAALFLIAAVMMLRYWPR